MKKNLLVALLALMLTLACGAFAEDADLIVWAIESAQITDYQTNGQSKWMQEQTGVSVSYISQPRSGWYTAFQAVVMSGEKIDVFLYEFDTSEAAMLGTDMAYLIPLEEYISEENTPNIHAILKANPQIRELITAPDGHIYTLFTNNAYDLSAYKQKLWVNKYFLEAYTEKTGCGLPQTTAEFEAMLKFFAENDMNGDGELNEVPFIGMNGVDGMYNLFGAFLASNSGEGFGCVIDENGDLTFAYDQEAYREALAYVSGLYAQGLISPDTFTTDATARYALTSGSRSTVRAGVVSGVNAAQVVQLSSEADAMTYDDYIPLPPLEGPDGVRTIVTAGETILSLRNGITAMCEDPVAAIKWLDAGYSEAARLYAIYGGLENVDWAYADGQTLAGEGKTIVTLHDIAENSTWNGQGIVYRITEEDYLAMNVDQIAVNDALATYRANLVYRPYAVRSPWPAIVWPGAYTQEASEYSQISSLIKTTVTEYYTDVILGRKNLEGDWDAYVKTLGDMGLARYLELSHLYIDISSDS